MNDQNDSQIVGGVSSSIISVIAGNQGIFVAAIVCVIVGLTYIQFVVDKFEPNVESKDCIEGTSWGPWSACTKSCGGGVQFQHRIGDEPSTGNGKVCSPDVNIKNCNMDDCNVDYEIGTWSGWGLCDPDCGPGIQTRTTIGDTQSSGTGKTANDLMIEMNTGGGYEGIPIMYDATNNNFYQTQPCDEGPCPVNCEIAWDIAPVLVPGTYKNPKYDPDKASEFLADGFTPNPLYEPEFIDNPDSMASISNPLYNSFDPIQIPNPHYDPNDPNQPDLIDNPNREPEFITNQNYNPAAGPTMNNPNFEPEYINIPADPWGSSQWTNSDGYDYCKDEFGEYISCGTGGTQTRTGIITQQPLYGGTSCGTGPAFIINGNAISETHSCNQIDCPIDCKFNDWIPVVEKVAPVDPDFSCAIDTLAKDNLLRVQGWEDCDKNCVDITTDTEAGVRRRLRTAMAATGGGDECDVDDLTEELECNNFRCPDIRDFLGGWKSLSNYNHAGATDETDYMPFKSFVIYYDNTIPLNGDKTRENGFYSIYLNVDDKTSNFPDVSAQVLGQKNVDNYTLQLYDNMWRLYDLVLESPTQLNIQMKNLITHEKYNMCFIKFNNTSIAVPGLGTKLGWRYTSFDTVGVLPDTVTGIEYDDALTDSIPTATDWVYDTDGWTSSPYDGSCEHNYDGAAYSFYCPFNNDRQPFNLDDYLGKWSLEGTDDPIIYYNIIKTVGGEYRMHYNASQSGYYALYEDVNLPHWLTGVKRGSSPDQDEWFVIHKPKTVNNTTTCKVTGFKIGEIDENKQFYDPTDTFPGGLTYTGPTGVPLNFD